MESMLPQGSRIKVVEQEQSRIIIIPYPPASPLRYFIGIFMLFWLGGWAVGFVAVLTTILNGKGTPFLIFWLGAWTIGGVFAFFFLFRIFRGAIPEQWAISKETFFVDTGVTPFRFSTSSLFNQLEAWKNIFAKRKSYLFDREQIRTIKLREVESGNKITIDRGPERIEIALGASDVEKEWLFNHLNESYLK